MRIKYKNGLLARKLIALPMRFRSNYIPTLKAII